MKDFNTRWSNIRYGVIFLAALVMVACQSVDAASSANSVSLDQLALNPPSISFGSVPVGQSRTQTATLNNSGSSSVTLSQATVTGTDFSLSGLSLSLTLAAGQSVTFNVNFAPSSSSVDSGTLSLVLRGRHGWNTATLTAPVSGTGTGALTPPPTITTSSLPGTMVGAAYSVTLSASGGTPPYKWGLASGQLPPGLALAPSSGVISGTPTTAGSSTFTVQATDSASATAKAGYTVSVGSAPSSTVVWSADMETANLSQWTINGTKGGSYDSGTCMRPSNGVSTEHAHSGSYSMKMTIDTSVQESGCRQFRNQEPEAGGTYYYGAWYYIPQNYQAGNYWNVFQFKSNNGSTEDPFWVLDLMPRKTDGAPHLKLRWKGVVSGPYASDCCTGTKYYDQAIAAVPVGQWFHVEAYLKQASDATGRLTIRQDGVLLWDMVNVKTKYPGGDQRWGLDNYSDGVSPNPTTVYVDDATISTQPVGPSPDPLPLQISTVTLPDGTLGVPFSTAVTASGGGLPYSWSVIGQLPTGLNLSSSTGVISGTPTQAGAFSFSIQVKDSNSATAGSGYTVNISTAVPSPLQVTTSTLPGGTVGIAYKATLTAIGGTSPYTWSAGQLPTGLSLAPSSGVISGTPSQAGSFTVSVQVSDSASAVAMASYTVTIASAPSNTTVWSANMETADLSQWLTGGVSQASYDSGTCIRPTKGVSTDYARSGSYSMKMTIDTSSQESGCRQFRSIESKTGGTYYYGAWFYIPQTYMASSYWNIFQFKSNNGSTEDPFWVVDLMPRSTGTIHLRLRWKEGHAGPYATSGTSNSPMYFDQILEDVPAGQWFHIEAYLVQSSSFTGHLTIWQDGVQLWDLANINTKFSGGDQRWSTNNYSDRISPNPTSVYVDDATVSTQRVGP